MERLIDSLDSGQDKAHSQTRAKDKQRMPKVYKSGLDMDDLEA